MKFFPSLISSKRKIDAAPPRSFDGLVKDAPSKMKFVPCAAALLMRGADKAHMVDENIRMVQVCGGLLLGGAEWHRTQHNEAVDA